jgi:hypothetical protein
MKKYIDPVLRRNRQLKISHDYGYLRKCNKRQKKHTMTAYSVAAKTIDRNSLGNTRNHLGTDSALILKLFKLPIPTVLRVHSIGRYWAACWPINFGGNVQSIDRSSTNVRIGLLQGYAQGLQKPELWNFGPLLAVERPVLPTIPASLSRTALLKGRECMLRPIYEE